MRDYTHGGNVYKLADELGCPIDEIIDLSSNINPEFPEEVNKILAESGKLINRLPEPNSLSLINVIAKKYGIEPKEVIAGSGSTELIDAICRAFRGKKCLLLQPTYSEYEKYAELNEISVSYEFLSEDKNFRYTDADFLYKLQNMDLMFVCNPNNPTGGLVSKDELRFLAEIYKNVTFVIDESYMAFSGDCGKSMIGGNQKNILVLKSFSKVFGVPGIRSGFLSGKNQNLLEQIREFISPWSLNSFAQEISKELIQLDTEDIAKNVLRLRDSTEKKLRTINGVKVFSSHANYILMKLENKTSAETYEFFKNNKILIRDCSNFVGLSEGFIRVSVRKSKDMDIFIKLLKQFMGEKSA